MRAPLLPLLTLALALTGCGDAATGPHEGQHAPSMNGPTVDGRNAGLGSVAGKPALVVFWASWCGPCRREAPLVAALASSYGDRLGVIGVNAGEDSSTARAAAEALGMTWPVLLDMDGRIAAAYEVEALPTLLVLDADGIVRYRGHDLPSDIHRLLDGLRR